ncbi:AraC family transcriptional regulator [Mycobacterium sp. 852013-51886_SCH5428379]|uniref:AraC family transcriptional regulator n=1 Tax=Mycobacterium sp. 852013-51886_SCH5428379 TaxID=1834111 RepID=UPI000A84050A|nr:AraC family transcriptional regulator [Mycobacterium sp. 852013-51886_SCH5428379]
MAAVAERVDPVGMLVSLLRPATVGAKVISGSGEWAVRVPRYADPAFCVMLEGSCVLRLDDHDQIELCRGDFLFVADMPGFVMESGHDGVVPALTVEPASQPVRHGSPDGPETMRMLGGYFRFDATNAALLTPMLPRVLVVHQDEQAAVRLHRIVELIADETASAAPSELILDRLVEVLLIEAMRLRVTTGGAQRGLIAGLSDSVLAPALRQLHADVARGWTVAQLAREASVSRTVFAERFSRTTGMSPMQYLLQLRMALAQEILRTEQPSMAELARRVGYQSAGAFTTAFSKLTGRSPSEFRRNS